MDRKIFTDNELNDMASLFNYRGLPYRWKILENVFDIKFGDVVLDGGAFHGDMTLYFSKKVGDSGKVLSCEAYPPNIRLLRVFTKKFKLKNSILIPYALSDEIGETNFYISEYINAGSILKEFRKVDPDRSIRIKTITIDEIVRRYSLKKIDYMWFNIEGAELKALRGAENTLKKFDVKLLIDTHAINNYYSTTGEVISLLEDYGYESKPLEEKPRWIYAWK